MAPLRRRLCLKPLTGRQNGYGARTDFCTPTTRRAPPLLRGHSAGVFEFCSGLVDLVVGVGHHGGGGHRLALAGERFVGLVAEGFAEVGDGNVRLWNERSRVGRGGESTDGGGRFVVPKPVEQWDEDGQRLRQQEEAAGVVVVPGWQDRIVEGVGGLTVGGRQERQYPRNACLGHPAATVLSDCQAPAEGLIGGGGSDVAVGGAIREENPRGHVGVVDGVGGGKEFFRGRPCVVIGTCHFQRDGQQ